MTGSAPPLLFLDVDGPLTPFGATREQLPGGYRVFEGGRLPPGAAANPLVTRIDPGHRGVDDEITRRDRARTRAHHPGQALLHHVDPRYGLTEDDFAVLRRWLRLHRG